MFLDRKHRSLTRYRGKWDKCITFLCKNNLFCTVLIDLSCFLLYAIDLRLKKNVNSCGVVINCKWWENILLKSRMCVMEYPAGDNGWLCTFISGTRNKQDHAGIEVGAMVSDHQEAPLFPFAGRNLMSQARRGVTSSSSWARLATESKLLSSSEA